MPSVEQRLIEALRALPVGSKPRQSALRSEIGCSTAELSACIQSMRFKGKLHWERLELSGSLLVEAEYQGASGTARKASGGSSSGEPKRIADRAPFEREQASAVPATPAPDLAIPEHPTGADLAGAIRSEAERRGVTIATLVSELRPGHPSKYLEQLQLSQKPTASTVARIRALLAGEPVPPLPDPRRRGTNSTASTLASADRQGSERAAQERLKRDGFRAHEVRRPGEALADANARLGQRLRAIGAEIDAEEAQAAKARRDAELDALATPSSLLRRAQRDWPDQCGAVRALASELGVGLAEAWHRVIKAGLDCLGEAEGEAVHG